MIHSRVIEFGYSLTDQEAISSRRLYEGLSKLDNLESHIDVLESAVKDLINQAAELDSDTERQGGVIVAMNFINSLINMFKYLHINAPVK